MLPQDKERICDLRLVIGVVILAILFQIFSGIVWREDYKGDEGFYGTMALNMVQDRSYLIRPSSTPVGSFEETQPLIAHPQVNSILMAGAYNLFGHRLAAFDVVPLISFIFTLVFLYLVVALWDRDAAAITILLASVSPSILHNFRFLEAEPIMAFFGMASIYCAALASMRGRVAYAGVAGLLLGLAFITKVWLAMPYAIAGGCAILFLNKRGLILRSLVVFLVCFVLFGCLHLAATAIWAPQDLAFWVKQVYLGPFTGIGIQAGKLTASNANLPANWIHPYWYYFGIAYRDHFFLFPLIALGCLAIRPQDRSMLYWLMPGLASVLLLSFFAIKEPLYALPIWIFLYPLAGICFVGWLSHIMKATQPVTIYTKAILAFILLSVAIILMAYVQGIGAKSITSAYVVGYTASMTFLVFLIGVALSRYRVYTVPVLIGSLALMFATYITWDLKNRRLVGRSLQEVVRPYVSGSAPNQVAFLAPNFKAPQLYLFQRGMYWRDAPLQLSPAQFVQQTSTRGVRVFIVDAEEERKMKPLVKYLEEHTKEITEAYDKRVGRKTDTRIFVLPSTQPALE